MCAFCEFIFVRILTRFLPEKNDKSHLFQEKTHKSRVKILAKINSQKAHIFKRFYALFYRSLSVWAIPNYLRYSNKVYYQHSVTSPISLQYCGLSKRMGLLQEKKYTKDSSTFYLYLLYHKFSEIPGKNEKSSFLRSAFAHTLTVLPWPAGTFLVRVSFFVIGAFALTITQVMLPVGILHEGLSFFVSSISPHYHTSDTPAGIFLVCVSFFVLGAFALTITGVMRPVDIFLLCI